MFIICLNPDADGRRYEELEQQFSRLIQRKIHECHHNMYNNEYLYNLCNVYNSNPVYIGYAVLEGFISAIRFCFYNLITDIFRIPFVSILPFESENDLMHWLLSNEYSNDISFIAGPYHENQLFNVFFESALIGDTLLYSIEHEITIENYNKMTNRIENIIGRHIIRKNNIS
jgi:hypothetical protein